MIYSNRSVAPPHPSLSPGGQGCPGNESISRRRMPGHIGTSRVLSGCRDTERKPGMRYVNSIFASLLKPIDRRSFQSIVSRHDGDAYYKSFKSWDHLTVLIYAQLSRATSLRGSKPASTPMPT